jgi:hypothetical protein
VSAYAADGRADVGDAHAGSRIAQLSAQCGDNAAFARPIDVTAIVRQLSVPAGVRYVGFNIRKANNRQGPGLFDVAAGKLTIVLADEALAHAPRAGTGRPQARRQRDAQDQDCAVKARRCNRSKAMKLYAYSTWAAVSLACGAAVAMTGDHVAVAFRGEWVPAKAACTSPLKLVIDANVVTRTARSAPSSGSRAALAWARACRT